jgi:hypothetical protein
MRCLRIALVLVMACGCSGAISSGGGRGGGGKADGEFADGGVVDRLHLQMNDLSILFPLANSDHEFSAYLQAASPGLGGDLLPEALFAAVDSRGIVYANLRVVSFRLDPCFANVGPIVDPSTCQNQLRVIFQPLTFANGTTTTDDSAVHAFYSLTRDQLVAAVREIAAARRESSGDEDLGPLSIHPVVAQQGLDGPMGASLEAIITKYAGASNLIRFTLMDSASVFGPIGNGEQRFWNFNGFDVVGGVATPMIIPTLGSDDTEVNFETMATDPLIATLSPPTTSTDDLHLLANATQARQATTHEQQAALDAALRIENPNFHSPNNIDCSSCHTAQAGRQLVAENVLGLTVAGNPNAFVADPSIPSGDAVTTTMVNNPMLNLHAFSYRNTSPMINQRVVNETAVNLAYLATLDP